MSNSRLVGAAGALTAAGLLAVAVVGHHEGVRTVAYRDAVGVPTVCFGETRGVKMGDRHSLDECKLMLKDGLVEFETGVRKCLNHPDNIPDKTYVALISFSWNVGTGAFCRSSVARRVNAWDLRGACEALMNWTRAGGRVLPGLVKRRREERALCLEGLQ